MKNYADQGYDLWHPSRCNSSYHTQPQIDHTIIAQSSPQALHFSHGFAKRRARNASDCWRSARFLLPAFLRRKFSSSETSRYGACYHQNYHEHHSIFDHQYQISFSAGECWAGHKLTHNYRALGKGNIGECIGDDYQPCGAYDRYCMGKTFTNMVYELGKLSINGEPKPIPNDRYFGFSRKYWCWTVL